MLAERQRIDYRQPQPWQWVAVATKAQKEELRELIAKLGWSEEFWEASAKRKVDEMLYMEIIGWISGVVWMIQCPGGWTKGEFKTLSDLKVNQVSLYG